MSMWAVSPCVVGALVVLLLSDRFQVIRVNAGAVSAEVIDMLTLRDRSIDQLVCGAMRTNKAGVAPAFSAEDSVAIGLRALPLPAASRFVSLDAAP